jgi:RNA polymerase sigma-70 factor (ECF subfamily)
MAGGAAYGSDGSKAERFKTLALPHLDEIYTLARYLLRGASDADDAVQECYLRAFRHFDTFRGGPIKPWLLAILRNVCRSAHAKNSGLVFTDVPVEPDDGVTPVWSSDSETPEHIVLRRHDTETMRRLIADLPADYREVIVLREINDLSYRDIAAIIDSPIGTVMSRLSRARVMLRNAWIAAEGEETRT